MKSKIKSSKTEKEIRRAGIRKMMSRVDKKIEERVKFFITQIEKTYQN